MGEGKAKATWQQTASILAMLANTAFGKKKDKVYTASDFNPHVKTIKKVIVIDETNRHLLREAAGIPPRKEAPIEKK